MSDPDLLVDTSVAIALVVEGHEAHQQTLEALEDRRLGLAGHAWFETFSVLNRLPPPVRRASHEVTSILGHNFPESRFLSERAAQELTNRLARIGVAGGAVYDALVAQAAKAHQLPLASRDHRAVEIYRALGVTVELLA